MHRILIVDDEPLICRGLSSLLAGAGLGIADIHMAHTGFEALDYLRMEEVDLMITDIGMPGMNGIELMHQARLIKPWVQTIVISAHETFQYAQMAMRLGARDYLIKPLNSAQLLDSVRNALLQMQAEKPASGKPDYAASMGGRFALRAPDTQRGQAMTALMAGAPASPGEAQQLASAAGLEGAGPYFAMIRIGTDFSTREGELLPPKDKDLLAYALMNMASELLDQDWSPLPFTLPNWEIGLLIGWSEERYDDSTVSKINQLDMIGRSLHHHAAGFLRLPTLIGISQIARGPEFIHLLANQSQRALEWSNRHPGQKVFYYGDFSWSQPGEEAGEEEAFAQNNRIVERSRQYIEEHYAQKGLTLHEVSQRNHVSPNYLSYLFKKNTGYNLWEYVIKLRMEEGRRLLLTTDLRRYEVAERVGYESPEHFSKIFKKYYGYSPSELKKEHPAK
ncbi:response regulator [Paenibacillus herberti]|uniref:DNA-binding response regulator n=1 Tax=Paenibacillus herberti TaxID=1619309 RepID=A0A229P4C7_9BACL|nr:response regulator [Paenibacillus herberti]OXM17102.1 DNA-binding response regulator [Paenibacillus herberti]